ncbi:Lrp/AsnC family transcriptional regulator [Aliiroseovarius marinus]|uniref:Lrp/AsnC family transcriptional regulator n=1 Tax=Aliiroseovarius marinus TaxID=2500159 RepID=UPI003D7ED437
MPQIDQTDRRLLKLLQRNAQLTSQELGEALNLSASQAGRRRQRLEETGMITRYAAQIDPRKLGLDVQAFMQVELASQAPQAAQAFQQLVESCADITSVWTLTGESDFLMRVYCANLAALNDLIHRVLLPHPAVARVHSQIVLDQTKRDAPLPLP